MVFFLEKSLVVSWIMLNFAPDLKYYLKLSNFLIEARIQQASAKLRNVFVKALLWC